MPVPTEDFEKDLTPENLSTYLSEEEMHEYPYLGNYKESAFSRNENLSNSKEN